MRSTMAILAAAIVLASCSDPAKNGSDNSATASAAAKPTWEYQTQEDKMRGQKQWVATLAADNPAQLDFPYQGGSPGYLAIFQNSIETPFYEDVLFQLGNGQIDCSQNCAINIKFDDGPVLTTGGRLTDCGGLACMNLDVMHSTNLGEKDQPKFSVTKALLKSKRVTVEVPIYKLGRYQFTFSTAGLKWPQQGAPERGMGDDVKLTTDPIAAHAIG